MIARSSRNKYNRSAPEERTWLWKIYDSRAEMEFAQLLWLDPSITMIREQPKIELGIPENIYRPDFYIRRDDGNEEFIDVKGAETAKFRKDKKLWMRYGPGLLKVVKKVGPGRFETVEEVEGGQAHGRGGAH